MPKKLALSTLNASTLDILNVIRQNASLEYQSLVPEVTVANDIPKVGEVLYGHPAMANQFLNALINRIALVRINSLVFNNPYRQLKKGFLEYGETVEEIFVNIAKVRTFNPEKSEAREFQRNLPDVKSAFHVMNYRVQYPVTIQDEDLKQAFLSMEGVQNLIAKIVDGVYRAAEYDEFLLFKYMLIKEIAAGHFEHQYYTGPDLSNAAVQFRYLSNILTFPQTTHNESGVLTNTPRERQLIFMSSKFNAQYDVGVLAAAFNMDKADFMGRLFLIDDWTTFNNERFLTIQSESNMLPPVTQDDLDKMANLTAVIVDEEWFQVYDNHARFTEKYIASGESWNYFYNVWKTFSHSPFSNAIAIFDAEEPTMPSTVTGTVTTKDTGSGSTVLGVTIRPVGEGSQNWRFVQSEALTTVGIGAQPYGAFLIPDGATGQKIQITNGTTVYESTAALLAGAAVGTTLTFNPVTQMVSDCPVTPCEPGPTAAPVKETPVTTATRAKSK